MIGEISGLAAAAAWAVISTIMRSVSERTSPVLVNALRCIFSGITLVALLLFLGRTEALLAMPLPNLAALIASGILGQAMGDGFFVRSMKIIGASRALPISSTQPLLTVGLAMILLGERISWMGIIGTILVLFGIYLLAFPYGPLGKVRHLLEGADKGGILLALAAAVCWAGSTILMKVGLVNIDLVAAATIRMATAAILLMGLEVAHSRGRIPVGISRRSLAIMTVAGVIGAFSTFTYLSAVNYAGAAKAAILVSTSPLFGLPLSLLFLRERINSRIVVGTLLTVFGIWLVLGG